MDPNVTPQIKAPLGNCLSQTVTYGTLIWSGTFFGAEKIAWCESGTPKLVKVLEQCLCKVLEMGSTRRHSRSCDITSSPILISYRGSGRGGSPGHILLFVAPAKPGSPSNDLDPPWIPPWIPLISNPLHGTSPPTLLLLLYGHITST